MAAPLTGLETDGGWTSLDHEASFLGMLADETSATVTVAGQSVQGRDIHRVDLGNPGGPTFMVTALVHADEPASREALLAWLRDLAYSTDPDVAAYLAEHRIVALTPCNPDGFVVGTRNNGNGVNINRDFYRLTQPETRLIQAVANEVRPNLALDAHEFQGVPANEQWLGRAGGDPMAQPSIQAAQDAVYATCRAALDAQGYSTAPYWLSLLPRQGWSSVLGMKGIVGMLSETNTAHDPETRVAVHRVVFDEMMAWHQSRGVEITEATTAARMLSETTNPPRRLFTKQFVGDDIDPEVIHVAGYQLETPLPEDQRDAFGVAVNDNGFVSMLQAAQPVIPTLLDPSSQDRAATASRIPAPRPRGPLIELRVHADGRSRPVEAGRLEIDGRRQHLRNAL